MSILRNSARKALKLKPLTALLQQPFLKHLEPREPRGPNSGRLKQVLQKGLLRTDLAEWAGVESWWVVVSVGGVGGGVEWERIIKI